MAPPNTQLKDHWQEQRLFLSRVIAAGIVVLLLSGLLVARLFQLQVVNYERFAELSRGNRFRIEPQPPTRGLIFDRNGLVIADNTPNWELVAVAEEIESLDQSRCICGQRLCCHRNDDLRLRGLARLKQQRADNG